MNGPNALLRWSGCRGDFGKDVAKVVIAVILLLLLSWTVTFTVGWDAFNRDQPPSPQEHVGRMRRRKEKAAQPISIAAPDAKRSKHSERSDRVASPCVGTAIATTRRAGSACPRPDRMGSRRSPPAARRYQASPSLVRQPSLPTST